MKNMTKKNMQEAMISQGYEYGIDFMIEEDVIKPGVCLVAFRIKGRTEQMKYFPMDASKATQWIGAVRNPSS